MKTVVLGELLPDEPIKEITRILNSNHLTGCDLHSKLVEALAPYTKPLRDQGVLVDYLAYCIEAKALHGEGFDN